MCHAGGARTPLTNEELEAAEHLMREAALEGTVAVGTGVGLEGATHSIFNRRVSWH